MFLAPNFFLGGELPEFLESIYKINTDSDHVAKFRDDRPRELGDYALKKKKTITSKTEDLPFYRTGGLIRTKEKETGKQYDISGTVADPENFWVD